HLLRSDFLRTVGQPKDASKEVAEALKLEPKDVRVVGAAAQAAIAEGKLDQARTHLQRGLKEHPENAEMYRLLARVEVQSKRVDDAVSCLRQGADTVPEESRNLLRKDLAEILIQKRDAEAANVIKGLRDRHAPQAMLDELEARECMQKGQWLQAARLLES